MGDRVTLAVQDGEKRVYLYSHWAGYDMPEILRRALARRQRWDDPSYLTRIIFSTMTKGDEDSETGYGISHRIQDYEHPLIVVNVDKQEVSIEAPEPDGEHYHPSGKQQPISFEDYVKSIPRTWHSLDPSNLRYKPEPVS